MATKKTPAELRAEAVARGWAKVGSDVDDPSVFRYRPEGNSQGRAFTSLEAFLDGYDTVSESKIRTARAEFEELTTRARHKVTYAENFWGGAEGLQWYCKLYGVTEAHVLQALKKD